MSTKKTEDGFLSRWSRRMREDKAREAEAEQGADERPSGDETASWETKGGAPEAGRAEAGAEEAPPEFTEEDVEKLGPGADYSVFMKKGVAPHIRRLALRKLWLSNPVLANLDGLVEYGEDYRASALAQVGKVVSSWKVGKGYAAEEEGAGEDGEAGAEAPKDVAEAAPESDTEQDGDEGASKPATESGAGSDKG